MTEGKICAECGVPKLVTREHLWLDNGDIVQARDGGHRIAFIESENLDPLFQGIEQIIGTSIEHIVIEAVRRNLRAYLQRFIPDEVRAKIERGELDPTELDKGFMALAEPMGYGKYEPVEYRYEKDADDYFTVSISEPFSLPMCAASHCAAVEAVIARDCAVNYSRTGPDTYRLIAFPYPQPRAYKGRLRAHRYRHADGDLELERCPSCGGPRSLTEFNWYPGRGVIASRNTRRRMAFVGPMELDPVFSELEAELGEAIPQAVVEAQRRFTKTGFYSMQEIESEGDFRLQLALRGLGNLRELKITRRGLHMLVENAALPMLVVGMMQGAFEMAFGLDTVLEWEMSRGNLRMELHPRSVAVSV